MSKDVRRLLQRVILQEGVPALSLAQSVNGVVDASPGEPGGDLGGRIELLLGGDVFQDGILHRLLGFAGIVENPQGDIVQPPVVFLVELRDLLSCHLGHFLTI